MIDTEATVTVDKLDPEKVREDFPFLFGRHAPINVSAMTIAANPFEVREAMDRHQQALDTAPYQTQLDSLHDEESEVCEAVHEYFTVPKDHIALTTGTTLGLGLLYAGLQIRPGQEILTTEHEFSRTLGIFDAREARDGVRSRRLRLMTEPSGVTFERIRDGLKAAICSHTRILALQWVYSNSGVKLPIDLIGEWLEADINPGRAPEDRVLLCVDGVHGFGVEKKSFLALRCDFFVSGCHKWVFGPRGTGIWCGTEVGWSQYKQFVPTSSKTEKLGLRHSPGGVQAYDHIWALEEAFRYLLRLGPQAIQDHVHAIATDLKERLARISGVKVITPMSSDYSAGIVCFDIRGISAADAVAALLKTFNIRASVSSSDAGRPPDLRHVRMSVAAFNTPSEIEACAAAVESLAKRGC
jgi:isopenicillin-N epimerase